MRISWQVPVNTQPLQSINFLRIRRGSSIPPSLQNYEGPFNWAKQYPLTFQEISHGLFLLEEKFQDESSEIEVFLSDQQEVDTDAPKIGGAPRTSFFVRKNATTASFGISLIARKLTQAQFHVDLENFSSARECLSDAEYFLSSCSSSSRESARLTFSDEYREGFQYILDGLKVFLEVQISNSTTTTTSKVVSGEATSLECFSRRKHSYHEQQQQRRKKVSLDGLKHFKRLPAKAKYIVWTVKDIFMLACNRANVERHDWMEKVLIFFGA